jgi:hypothetical protein
MYYVYEPHDTSKSQSLLTRQPSPHLPKLKALLRLLPCYSDPLGSPALPFLVAVRHRRLAVGLLQPQFCFGASQPSASPSRAASGSGFRRLKSSHVLCTNLLCLRWFGPPTQLLQLSKYRITSTRPYGGVLWGTTLRERSTNIAGHISN